MKITAPQGFEIAQEDIKVIKTKYCLYARKSSESEERQVLSIDSQIKEMLQLAEREGLEIVAMKRESHSAKETGQRTVFNEIVEEISSGKYNAILTWAPDRISRNAGDLGKIVDLMDAGKLLQIRTFGQTFGNNPNEKFLLMILGSQAKLENDTKLFKKLTDDIWEFRTLYKGTQYRLFAFWDKTDKTETLVLSTHGMIKKVSKVPKSEIEKALKIKAAYFDK